MATKIVTKNSSTASAVPTASDLVQGELAVNVADKRLFTEDNAGAIVELGTNPTTLNVNGTATMEGLNVDTAAPFMSFKESGATKLFIGESSAVGGGAGYYDFYAVTGLGQRFFTNSLERMRIDSAGNVGIGTSSPTETLTLNASADYKLSLKHPSDGSYAALGAINNNFLLYNNGAERMRIDSAGNVGIGTSSPSNKLEIRNDVAASVDLDPTAIKLYNNSDGGSAIEFSNGVGAKSKISLGVETTGAGTDDSYLGFSTGANTALSERMRIDSAGNVGIGESNPQELLHLTATTPVFRMQGGSRTYQQFVSGTSFTIRDVSAGLNRVTLDSAGNLLVGKTNTTLSVTGIENRADGRLTSTRSGNTNLVLNRLSSDGSLIDLYKNGVSVGSIGTIDGDFNIYASASGHKGLRFGNGFIAPTSNSITIEDATTDLGLSTHRFKDLYLSGTVYAGSGTIAAGQAILTVASSNVAAGNEAELLLSHAGNNSFKLKGGSDLKFSSDGGANERARITNAGTFLLGTTSTTPAFGSGTGVAFVPTGESMMSANSTVALFLNRTTSYGAILNFRKDGTSVGSISSTATGGGSLVIGNASSGIMFRTDLTSSAFIPANPTTGAQVDNTLDIGHSAIRFDDIYATNGTIQTSDRNEKQDIAELSDAEQRVAVAAKGLLRKFRWKDSVAEKGDEARTHFGIIAQDLQAAFAAEGLDAGDYAMFISSTWTDEETNEEKTRMGVRYSELLAFIIAAI